MHLINTTTLRLEEFLADPPPYAILSHTWGDDEVSFADFHHTERRKLRKGFKKIALTCQEAMLDNIGYAWVDTCCINKDSSAELSEAINSMFRWYQNAQICYAYLEDLTSPALSRTGQPIPRSCKWLSRGWTLQELLAPTEVVFYVPHWIKKPRPLLEWTKIGQRSSLIDNLTELTRIPPDVLSQQTPLSQVSVADRMSWASRRVTTRKEDEAYCLLGIFDVNIPLLYGEGHKAFLRLQEAIVSSIPDDSLFAWRASPQSAREFPCRGLLASSPSEFNSDESITPFQLRPSDSANVLGSGWMSLSCAIWRQEDNEEHLGLKCFPGGDVSMILGINAIAVQDGVYVRTDPDRLELCPHGEFEKITIEKYAKRKELYVFDDIYRRDGVFLEELPRGIACHMLRIGDAETLSPPSSLYVGDLVRTKAAFELRVTGEEVEADTSSYVRILVLLWVEREPGRRAYRYLLDAQKVDNADGDVTYELAEKPSEVRSRVAILLTRSVIQVTGAYKTVEGLGMFCITVTSTPLSRLDPMS